MCSLKEFGVRALLWHLGAADPCTNLRLRKWCNGGTDRAQVRRAMVMVSSFSRDHRWMAFGTWDASVTVLDHRNADSSKPEQLSGHKGRILSLAFSPDSSFLVASDEDRRSVCRSVYLGFVRIDAFCIDLAVVLARWLRCHIAWRRLHHALYPDAVFAPPLHPWAYGV
jgi:WD40 repeat protein